MTQEPSLPSIAPPERFRDGRWAERIEIAREAREATKKLRQGKPMALPTKRAVTNRG